MQQRIEQDKDLILRMLRRKLGEIDTRLETKVKRLKIKQLELLAADLLDFSSLDDLRAWLEKSKEKKINRLIKQKQIIPSQGEYLESFQDRSLGLLL
jgi:hypothetical protein